MPLHGYTAGTKAGLLLDAGVLLVASVPWGVSKGGLRVLLEPEYHEVDFDGRPAPIEGFDRILAWRVTVTGTFLAFGATQIQRVLHGITGVLAGGITTFTPLDGRTVFAPGNYVESLALQVERGDGTILELPLPRALVRYNVEATDRVEAGMVLSFMSRLSAADAAA